jgi:RNA recognition motif-containing protein
MTAPNSAYTLSSFGSAPFGEQPAPWENNENGSSEQFLNLTRNPHVQNDELNRFNYPNQNISSNISSSSSNNMNLNLNSDFMQHNEQKSSEIEGGVDFISHFPGPPIQTNKTCQQGPDGCNLFIFHIPNDLTNMDLYNLFTPFGAVISARIMVENETGRSRGFGFVSFDHPSGAHAAIRSMNGFQVESFQPP